MIGGGHAAPDGAALYNGTLISHFGLNDSYVTKNDSGHPSDNLAAVLAAAEYAGATGRDLMAALAVAYQVHCRLTDVAPVRAKGFDQATLGAYAAAAGITKALGLDRGRIANALAISGASLNSLRASRTGNISQWSGLAFPASSARAVEAALLAARGITGPLEICEGDKGFMDVIAGMFQIDWRREDLERVSRTIVRQNCADIHAQVAIENLLELKHSHALRGIDVESMDVEIFDVAYHLLGGGEEGDRKQVRTTEQALHSLPYLLAVAAIDGQVMPEQLIADRIQRDDVQQLLRRISIRPHDGYSRAFPLEMPCRISVFLKRGPILIQETRQRTGAPAPTWDTTLRKFYALAGQHAGSSLLDDIADAVRNLEFITTGELTTLLTQVGHPERRIDHGARTQKGAGKWDTMEMVTN